MLKAFAKFQILTASISMKRTKSVALALITMSFHRQVKLVSLFPTDFAYYILHSFLPNKSFNYLNRVNRII